MERKTMNLDASSDRKYTNPPKRKSFVNKGYSESAASRTKRSMRSFLPNSGDAHEDIDYHNDVIRPRARLLYMSSPIAAAVIKTMKTNTIGNGLQLKSRVQRDFLGLSEEEAVQWEQKTEAEFALWAKQKRNCDCTGMNNFYELQNLAFGSCIMSGDCVVLLKHIQQSTLFQPYTLRLHVLEADRICTPENKGYFSPRRQIGETKGGNAIFDGVEVDKNGAVTAYHILNKTIDPLTALKPEDWVRVPAYGKETGLPNLLHLMVCERPEQYRGVSILAQAMEAILQTKRYTGSELTAANVESMLSVFILTQAAQDDQPLGTAGEPTVEIDMEREYALGPGIINHLLPGEDVKTLVPNRPAKAFKDFIREIFTHICAANELPAEVVLKDYDTSYSASRAARLDAAKTFEQWRTWFVDDFCRPVYEVWMYEAVARGRIQAPGFFSDPLIRSAWLNSEWIGNSLGQIDPVKEIQAEIIAIENGLLTREQAAMQLYGTDFNQNVEKLKLENEILDEISRNTDKEAQEQTEDDEQEDDDEG